VTTTYAIKVGLPPSEKQANWLRQMGHELGVNADTIETALDTRDQAGISAMLDQYSAAVKAQRATARRTAAPTTEPGYYVDANHDVYVVVPNKAGTRTYAKKLVFTTDVDGDRRAHWDYVPGAIYGLEGLKVLTVEEAARLGHLHGFCVICAKALTDPKSVEQGIGPVCIKRLAR
jgi:hypothetical protein